MRTLPVFPAILLLALAGCRATTSRPYFVALPTATIGEVELGIPEATRALAETMATDSIALATIKEADGYIDSGWLDAATLEHTSKRPLGLGVVRVRAWVNPSKDFWSELVVEATYRAMADPSRLDRELDLALPDDHPLSRKIVGVVRKMIERYGDAEALRALLPPAPIAPPAKADTGAAVKADSTRPAKADSTAKPDTAAKPKPPKPDTIPLLGR